MTTPFPDLSSITITTYDQKYGHPNPEEPFLDPDHPEFHPLDTPLLEIAPNSYVGGILWQVVINTKPLKQSYYSIVHGPHFHHKALVRININPILTLEVPNLTPNSRGSASVEEDNLRTRSAVEERAREQSERTIKNKAAPRPYQGNVHHQFAYHEAARAGAPMCVRGTPLNLRDLPMPRPQVVSLAQALMDADSIFVPAEPYDPQDLSKMTSVEEMAYQTDPTTGDLERPGEENQKATERTGFRTVNKINIQFILKDDDTTHSTPARILMTDANEISVARDTLDAPALAWLLDQAYPEGFKGNALGSHHTAMGNPRDAHLQMATAFLEGNSKAIALQLKKLANSFKTVLPMPQETITVTSDRGDIQVTTVLPDPDR